MMCACISGVLNVVSLAPVIYALVATIMSMGAGGDGRVHGVAERFAVITFCNVLHLLQ